MPALEYLAALGRRAIGLRAKGVDGSHVAKDRRAIFTRRGSLMGRRWWLAAILLVALFLRIPGLDKSVWEDEVSSFIEAQPNSDFAQHWGGFQSSFIIFRICDVLRSTGSMVVTRLPSLALGLLGIVFAWRLGRLWRHWKFGFTLALLMALWPFQAEWDTQVRYYSLMICFTMGMVLAWESWRLRPGWRRLGIALISVPLACLTHSMGIVFLTLPWIYVGWETLARVWISLRNVKRGKLNGHGEKSRGFPCGALMLGASWILLLIVSAFVLRCNLGSDWRSRLQAPAKTASPGSAAGDPANNTKTNYVLATRQTVLATPMGAVSYGRRVMGEMFQPGQWSIGPLIGSDLRPSFFHGLVRGGWEQPDWQPGGMFNTALLLALVLGTIALCFVSPPLALALWAIVLSTSMAMFLNRSIVQPHPRHYAAIGIVAIILVAFSAGELWRWALLPWRRRARLAARLTLSSAIIAGAGAVAFGGRATIGGATRVVQDWKGLYEETQRMLPDGAVYIGIGAKNIRFYHELTSAESAQREPRNAYESSRANAVFEGFSTTTRNWAVLEQLNSRDGLVCFRYAYWPSEYYPMTPPFNGWLPRETHDWEALHATVGPAGHRVFVTRGALALPLIRRLADGEKSYRLDCHYEVPGNYRLVMEGIGESSGLPVVKIDGNVIVLHKDSTPGSGPDGVAGKTSVIHGYATEFASPRDPGTTQTLQLDFSRSAVTTMPTLHWQRVGAPDAGFTAELRLNRPLVWSDAGRQFIGLPLDVLSADAKPSTLVARLVDPQDGRIYFAQQFSFAADDRKWNIGDTIWVGPLTIENAQAASWQGRPLVLTLRSMRADGSSEAIAAQERNFGNAGEMRVMNIRFIENAGRLVMQVGT